MPQLYETLAGLKSFGNKFYILRKLSRNNTEMRETVNSTTICSKKRNKGKNKSDKTQEKLPN